MTDRSAHKIDSGGKLLLFAVAMLLSVPAARAQLGHEGPAKAIALAETLAPYDVASIKQRNPADESPKGWSSGMGIHDDIFTATNATLKYIIEIAYDIKEDQISGLSGPVTNAFFDIEAKVLGPDGGPPPKLTDTQLQAMIIPLLADRFHLKAHLQTKVMPVYDLVVAHGGPKFKLSQADIHNNSVNWSYSNNDVVVTAKGASMADLAYRLSGEVGRNVIDKTGLTGRVDITLKWSDDIAAQQGGPNVVSIFTAIQEQLGLKLQPAKGPVDTLVVDHVEMPSAN